MNIYLIRHGQSEANLHNIYQNSKDSLSRGGKKQVKLVAERLKDIPIDFIYSSSYKRAKETSKIISKHLNKKIEYWESLKEGKRPTDLEGLRINDPKAIEIKTQIEKNWIKGNWKYSDDETFEDVRKRAQQNLEYLLKKHKEQNILCISHAIILKMMVCVAAFGNTLTPKIFWEFRSHFKLENTGITQLEYTDKHNWQLLSWNDTKHL